MHWLLRTWWFWAQEKKRTSVPAEDWDLIGILMATIEWLWAHDEKPTSSSGGDRDQIGILTQTIEWNQIFLVSGWVYANANGRGWIGILTATIEWIQIFLVSGSGIVNGIVNGSRKTSYYEFHADQESCVILRFQQ
jgi:hypothetical protein